VPAGGSVTCLTELYPSYLCFFCRRGNKNVLSANKYIPIVIGIIYTICYTAIWDQASWEIFCSNDVISACLELGTIQIATSRIFKAINPYYALLLRIHPDGFFCFRFCVFVQLEPAVF
jgi:hypothetical protein